MKDHFQMFANYNRWANGRLYDAARHLDEDAYHRDMGAFFGSLNGTLNHILVGDLIWMARFTGESEAPTALDTVLYDDREELREARMVEDARIVAFVERLEEADLTAPLRYHSLVHAAVVEQTLGSALAHFFNHQTHHRGQAHCLLSQLGMTPPPLDLVYFQRDSGIGML